MAERVLIAELEIDSKATIAEQQKLIKEINDLKKATKEAKGTVKEYSEENIRNTAQLKNAQKEYATNNRIIQGLTTVQKGNIKTVAESRIAVSALSAEWAKSAKTFGEQDKRTVKLKNELNKLNTGLKEQESGWGNNTRNVGNYKDGINQATGAATQFVPGAGKAAQAAKLLGVAFKLMLGPVGLIIAAIAAIIGGLKSFFTSSEEGQNALKRFQAVFQVVFGNIIDILSKFGKFIVEAITKPQEAMKKLQDRVKQIGDFFKNTFGNIIGGAVDKFVAKMLKGFAGIGLAWQKLKGVFTDNAKGIQDSQDKIAGLNDRIEGANKRIAEGAGNLGASVKTAWDKAKNGLSGFISEQEREIATAQRLADQQAALDVQIRNNLTIEAKRRTEIAKIRQKAVDKENVSAEERLKLLQRAFEVEDAILQESKNIAQQKYEIKKAQNALSNSTKEDLDEQAQLEAEIFRLEQQSFEKRVRLQSQLTSVEREVVAEKKKLAQESIALLESELDIFKATQQSKLEEGKRINEELYNSEVERLESIRDKEAEINAERLEAGLVSQQEANLRSLEVDAQFREQKAVIDEELKIQADEAALIDEENRLIAMQDQLSSDFEMRAMNLEAQRQNEIAIAKAVGADVTLINQKFAQQQVQLEAAKQNAKLGLAASAAGNIASIFGQESKVGKAAAIAQTTIDTFKSAQAAYSSLAGITIVGPVLGALAAAAAVAAGVSNINKIKSTNIGSSGSISAPSVSAPSISRSSSLSSGASASTGTGSLSASNLGASISTPGTGIQAEQTIAIQDGVGAALQENPNILVLEDFQQVEGRQVEVNEGSEL